MEKFTKEVFSVMSKEELQDVVETLQMKLEVAEKEIERLKADGEIGRKYMEHLKTEAIRLIRAVEGENAPLLKFIDKADVDTLKSIVDEYMEKGREKFKACSQKQYTDNAITPEFLKKADYETLLKLKEKFLEVN
jgi:hypothetical protein